MPSPATRNCGRLSILRVQLTSPFTRYFKPGVPQLPLSTFDLRSDNALEIPGEDATQNQQLVLSHCRREDSCENPLDRRSSAPSAPTRSAPSPSGNFQEITISCKVPEATNIFSASPVPTSPSPLLSMATTPLIQMSPPPHCDLSLNIQPLDVAHAAKEDEVMADSRIGELGKRRGFKGAPLFTAQTTKKPSTSHLSATLSPEAPFSPRLSPSAPRTARPSTPRTARPSTPRTPLATVTNLLRTPTLKSPKPPATPMECPVSEKLQQCYDLHDPFSDAGESFYDPEIVCASVPFSNMESLYVYRLVPAHATPVRSLKTFFKAIEAASETEPRIRDTTVYDTMVYSYEPEVKETGRRRARETAVSTTSASISSRHTTMASLPQPLSLRPDRVSIPAGPIGDQATTIFPNATCAQIDFRQALAATYDAVTPAIYDPWLPAPKVAEAV